jgi:hypothetical protein
VPSIPGAVRRNVRGVAIVYGVWCLFWIVPALFNIGESTITGHLALAITGMPLALASLYLPNGTVQGLLMAAVLGLGQWTALVAWWSTDEVEKER